MGLLDDAIRDHLELRRRHGADAGDVARQEREALGPVRRDTAGPPCGVAERPTPDDPEEYDPRPGDEVAEDDRRGGARLRRGPHGRARPAAARGARGAVALEHAEAERADRRDVVPADEEPEGDDVLEETPEFLQETPEHDRLWFEQKPPRTSTSRPGRGRAGGPVPVTHTLTWVDVVTSTPMAGNPVAVVHDADRASSGSRVARSAVGRASTPAPPRWSRSARVPMRTARADAPCVGERAVRRRPREGHGQAGASPPRTAGDALAAPRSASAFHRWWAP